MSSSDYEKEDNSELNKLKFVDTNEYVIFGTPIELKEEEIETGKKKIKIEDQIATDEKGRRRFHGAFTGGYSAGYFNTCGSKEGWIPTNFVSTRKDRNNNNELKNPEYFMDEEDFSEFGIAPKKYSAKSKYIDDKKEKIINELDNNLNEKHGVLKSLLSQEQLYSSLNVVRKQTIGFDLLRKMGWKEGRGIGEEKSISQESSSKVYTCPLPPHLIKKKSSEIFLFPQENTIKIPQSKCNLFGIGYKSLRAEAEVCMTSKCTEKISFKPTGVEKKGISGTAYGIGVYDEYEKEEDEIYNNDTLDQYDYSIDVNQSQDTNIPINTNYGKIWFGFIKLKNKCILNDTQYNLPLIPDHFKPNPILGKDVTNTYQKGSRIAYDTYQRTKLINTTPIENSMDTKKSSLLNDNKLSIQLSKRFVSSGHIQPNESNTDENYQLSAAKSGLFGKLTRTIIDWIPNDILCRRFNLVYTGNKIQTTPVSSKKKTQLEYTPSFITQAQPNIDGPLSLLNQNDTNSMTNNNDKTITNEEIINIDTKPSIDLFKAIFCDSDDENNKKTVKRTIVSEDLDNKIKKN